MFENEYFSQEELKCKCGCNECKIDDDFLNKLIKIRQDVGKPFIINSGYRCVRHNSMVGGAANSAHLIGKAVDIKCAGELAYKIIEAAIFHGMTGIGLQQKTGLPVEYKYIHIDSMTKKEGPRPMAWSYK